MWRLVLALKCFFLVLFARRLPPDAAALLPAPTAVDRPPSSALLPAPPESIERPPSSALLPAPPASIDRPPAPPIPAPPPPQLMDPMENERRGAIALLGLLQREGRLLDFLQEDVDGYTDSQIGAAVRDIHRGCRKALAEHVTIEPVLGEPDNATVRVEAGFDPSRIRLVGNVAGAPPFTGTLRHPGWRMVAAHLPERAAGHDPSVIAPAEVEL